MYKISKKLVLVVILSFYCIEFQSAERVVIDFEAKQQQENQNNEDAKKKIEDAKRALGLHEKQFKLTDDEHRAIDKAVKERRHLNPEYYVSQGNLLHEAVTQKEVAAQVEEYSVNSQKRDEDNSFFKVFSSKGRKNRLNAQEAQRQIDLVRDYKNGQRMLDIGSSDKSWSNRFKQWWYKEEIASAQKVKDKINDQKNKIENTEASQNLKNEIDKWRNDKTISLEALDNFNDIPSFKNLPAFLEEQKINYPLQEGILNTIKLRLKELLENDPDKTKAYAELIKLSENLRDYFESIFFHRNFNHELNERGYISRELYFIIGDVLTEDFTSNIRSFNKNELTQQNQKHFVKVLSSANLDKLADELKNKNNSDLRPLKKLIDEERQEVKNFLNRFSGHNEFPLYNTRSVDGIRDIQSLLTKLSNTEIENLNKLQASKEIRGIIENSYKKILPFTQKN